MPNNFTKDFAKLRKNPTIKRILWYYNHGLLTMRECLISLSLSQQVISMEIQTEKEREATV